MREVTWDTTGGVVARKKFSEAAYRRANVCKVRVWWAFGNIKKMCPCRCWLTFAVAGVSLEGDVDKVYWNRIGTVFGGGM